MVGVRQIWDWVGFLWRFGFEWAFVSVEFGFAGDELDLLRLVGVGFGLWGGG